MESCTFPHELCVCYSYRGQEKSFVYVTVIKARKSNGFVFKRFSYRSIIFKDISNSVLSHKNQKS